MIPFPAARASCSSGRDTRRGNAGMSGTAVYTWSNFGKVAVGEEIAGGGPEDPVADIAVIGTGIIFAGGALWEATHADTVRVTRTRNPEFCLIGPYSKIEKACKAEDGETHHIVPDMVYRLGARPTTAADQNSKAGRIPNSPTFNEGMSICLTEGEHRTDEEGIHRSLDPAINTLGASQTPAGTAPMPQILAASLLALSKVDGVSARCRELATAATFAQAASTASQPGRATTSLPSSAARGVLQQGHY